MTVFMYSKLMSEAVDQLRIRYRWKVLDAENQAIREHHQKKKEAKSKAERERIEKWEPERMENGENLSLDETCLSNGDVYTILTNKAAKGRKGL